MTPRIDLSIQSAAELIRAYGAVAIVGAGFSTEAGYPMLAQFAPLLRHALIEDADCRAALGAEYDGFVGGTDDVLSPNLLETAWASVAKFPNARQAFQRAFSLRDQEQTKRGSPDYVVSLAKMLHSRSIVSVISLNWDTQLESAYESEYGRLLLPDGQWLAKPHGDACHPEHNWVLPFELSNIDPQFVVSISTLAQNQPRVLLVVGYSERDEEIVSKIISPLRERWKVIRVGPGLSPPNIGVTAGEALPKLCAAVGAEDQFPEWEYVSFGASNGLAHALSGRGMLASDALECPPVPEVEIVANQLRKNFSAVLVGASGSGKSLVAFQAARSLSHDGWEIVVLRPGSITRPKQFPYKTLIIVDDAHSVGVDSVRRLFQSAAQETMVLLVSTDDLAGLMATVRIAAKRSVSAIANWMRKNAELVLPLVSALDDDVGNGYFQTSLESRIDRAEAEAKGPWEYTFILTGGWRRARQELAVLKEENDADLVLLAAAAHQLITADTGVSEDEVYRIMSEFGQDANECLPALELLRNRKLLSKHQVLRCPHLQYANVVVEQLCSSASRDRWEASKKIIEAVFDSHERKVQGCNWLLHALNFSDCFRWHEHRTAMNEQAKAWLSESIWNAQEPEDIRAGLFILHNLKGWLPDLHEQIESNLGTIAQFVENVDEDTAHAVAYFINWFSQENGEATNRLFADISPLSVAGRVKAIKSESAYPYANLISRLVNCAPKPWSSEFRKCLPWKHLEALIEQAQPKDIFPLAELAHSLIAVGSRREDKFIQLLIPRLAKEVSDNPVDAAVNVNFGFWMILSLPSFRPFWNLVSPERFADAISTGSPRDWHSLQVPLTCFYHSHCSRAKKISRSVIYSALLDTSLRDFDQRQSELVSILYYLSMYSEPKPVRDWMKGVSDRFLFPSRELSILLPSRAANLIMSGANIHLRMDGGFWGAETTLKCLTALSGFDPLAAQEALHQNIVELTKAISYDPKASSTEGIEGLIGFVQELDAELIYSAVQLANPEVLEQNWRIVLGGTDDASKRSVAAIQSIVGQRSNRE